MLSAQIEPIRDYFEEVKALFPVHYDELSEHKLQGFPLDPRYDVYLAREAVGEVLSVTLREDGKLIGYLVSFVSTGMHYQTCLTSITDIFFVYPDRRGLEGGAMLFHAWEKECRRRGVRLMSAGFKSKHAKHARALLEMIGFVETEIMFCKFLDGES